MKGCENGYGESCVHAGTLEMLNPRDNFRSVAGDKANGLALFQRGCDEHAVATACNRVSTLFITGVKDVIAQDMAKAFKYAEKGCELGNLASCYNTARMYANGEGTEKDEAKAKLYRERAEQMHKVLRDESGAAEKPIDSSSTKVYLGGKK